jgi:hypothetical protein
MPGGNVEFDDLYYREDNAFMQRLIVDDLRMDETDELKAVLEARLSASDLDVKTAIGSLPQALAPNAGLPEGTPAEITAGGVHEDRNLLLVLAALLSTQQYSGCPLRVVLLDLANSAVYVSVSLVCEALIAGEEASEVCVHGNFRRFISEVHPLFTPRLAFPFFYFLLLPRHRVALCLDRAQLIAVGTSYGQLLRGYGSDLGMPRFSTGLESLQGLDDAIKEERGKGHSI